MGWPRKIVEQCESVSGACVCVRVYVCVCVIEERERKRMMVEYMKSMNAILS